MTAGRKWLMGCGIGCGALLLLAVGSCVVGALYLRNTFRGIEKASASYDVLTAEMGDVADWVPPPDGVPPADRLELFATVREEVAEPRARLEAAMTALPPPELSEDGSLMGQIKVGLDTLGDLIDSVGLYLEARDQALLERRMSPGEYVYIYSLAYYSWLGHAPGDGPEARRSDDGVQIGGFDDEDGLFNAQVVRRRYRRFTLAMVRAQLAAVEPEAEAGDGETWRSSLEREIQRLEVDPGRVLWQDGLPPAIEAALEPFRGRLEATYNPSANRFELPLAEHEVPWEWQ